MPPIFIPEKEDLEQRELHLSILKKGPEAWNKWRKDNPAICPKLFGVDLSDLNLQLRDSSEITIGTYVRNKIIKNDEGLNLQCSNLIGTTLSGCYLQGADFRGCWADSADFSGADLRGAIFFGSDLTDANFRNASMRGCKLGGDPSAINDIRRLSEIYRGDSIVLDGTIFDVADLRYADFSSAYMSEASFEGSDLRYTIGFLPDGNLIKGARFDSVEGSTWRSKENPWFKLSRSYTGPQMAFNILFTIIYFIPYAGKMLFWKAINVFQQFHPDFIEKGTSVGRFIFDLRWKEYDLWQLAIGFDKGGVEWLIAILLLFYNFSRAILTYMISNMRYREEQTGLTPYYSHPFKIDKDFKMWFNYFPVTYGWIVYFHKVLQLIFLLAAIMFVVNFYNLLNTSVGIPVQ
ncbi:pentapeptide repeat-containing protein [Desulfopila sp. IMCC35008]|uniref:pentapeptide repeat-containing protein n=1 Tax=Desulfopila sp. IMCC35008 TaxID=2653858 RepID=UPI0013CFE01D|nr:pentapeptide repeat-containing protein [Desulfopila sp. IMCC35008]